MRTKATKVILELITLTMVVILAGCGGMDFNDASDDARRIADRAVGIADDFLDGNITASTAASRVNGMNVTDEIAIDAENEVDRYIRMRVFSLGTSLLTVSTADLTGSAATRERGEDRVLSLRNELAHGLSMRSR